MSGVHVPNLYLVKEVGHSMDYDKYEDGTADVYVLLKREAFPVLAVHEWGALVLIDGNIEKMTRLVDEAEYAIGEQFELSRPKILNQYIQVTDFNETLYKVKAVIDYDKYKASQGFVDTDTNGWQNGLLAEFGAE